MRIIRATRFSLQGLVAAFRYEAAFREEIIIAVLLSPIVVLLDVSIVEKLFLVLSVVLVLLAELCNSAIEAVVDRIGTEIHPLSGRAKDIGSAAVFVALFFAGFVWIIVVVPTVW